jgi:phage terminase small subunit
MAAQAWKHGYRAAEIDHALPAPEAPAVNRVQLSPDPTPPRHLSDAARGWWRQVVRQYNLEPHHLLLLQSACEELDEAERARQAVVQDGATLPDRWGHPRPHPMLDVGRKARNSFRLLVRELGLDASMAPVSEPRMPPRPGGR